MRSITFGILLLLQIAIVVPSCAAVEHLESNDTSMPSEPSIPSEPQTKIKSSCLPEGPMPLCVQDIDQMPECWRPPVEMREDLNPTHWSESETKDADYAFRAGVDEMINYFKRKPSLVINLWDDSIEPLMNVTSSSGNEPEINAKLRNATRANLDILVSSYLDNGESAECEKFEDLIPLAIFTHRLYPDNDKRTKTITKLTNASFCDCDSLTAAMGIDQNKILTADKPVAEDLFTLLVWSLWLTEAEVFADIELSIEAREFSSRLWKYFETYRIASAREFEEGAWAVEFLNIAELATHIPHILTGTQRFPFYVNDHPNLYRYFRENFYEVLNMGQMDLVAEFVDSLRQYGCTAENDKQVRDGSRYLLQVFHESGDEWMAYREEDQTEADLNDYKLIHKPWTGLTGLRLRNLEEPKPGTYGDIARRKHPHLQSH